MQNGKGVGDIVTANTSEKLDYVLGAITWHGWYLIITGIMEMLGIDKASRDAKKISKVVKGLDYSSFL